MDRGGGDRAAGWPVRRRPHALQILLLARIPLVERAFGQDRLARWHRWTGFTSFHLMLAHVVLITLGYAGPLHTNALAELWDLVVTYPGMLLAALGFAALTMVVVTSVRAARRRLRYESWHLLHLYAYLGVGLALPHQLWTGADFIGSPAARTYWWTLYAVAAGAVLVYRAGLPAWRSWRHRLTISHIVPEGPGLTSVYLRGRRLDRMPVRAGQFFQWRFLDGPGWSRAHPYSLSGPPRSDLLRITVKDLGDGSARVAALRSGTRVLVEGPYGRLTGQTYPGGPVTMFACGIGITPLLALLWELPYRHGEATLVYRARTEADLAFRTELEWLAAHRGRARRLPARRACKPAVLAAGEVRRQHRRGRAVPGRRGHRPAPRLRLRARPVDRRRAGRRPHRRGRRRPPAHRTVRLVNRSHERAQRATRGPRGHAKAERT
jgi:predicted ferric reductase